jgi:hypothetical protein
MSSRLDEVAKLFRGFSYNDPDAWKEFLGFERLRRPDGVLFNLGPKIHAHIENYVTKLTKALYYMHWRQIVPTQAAVEYFTASNAEIGEPHERQIVSMRFPGKPTPVRCSNARTKAPISDQFEYSYLGSDPTGDAVFKIRFHQTLIVASTVILDGRARTGGAISSY